MKSGRPRLLLVEDDPVSRTFLAEALAAVAEVRAVDSAATARAALAHAPGFDAWLLDAHLPDGDGISLLRAMRVHAPRTPALAHTADPDPALAAALRAAGFCEVLLKPLALGTVREAIVRACGAAPRHVGEAPHPPWRPTLERLFLVELPAQHAALQAARASGDRSGALALLHRLRGSCALVDARELDAAVRALQADPESASAWAGFERAVVAVAGVQDPAEVGEQVP